MALKQEAFLIVHHGEKIIVTQTDRCVTVHVLAGNEDEVVLTVWGDKKAPEIVTKSDASKEAAL